MNNIYIDRFLIVAFVKYILSQRYSHFLIQKPITLITQKQLVVESCPTPSVNNIFIILSIGLEYTLSFKRPDFDLKCPVTITPKVQGYFVNETGVRRIIVLFLNLLIVIKLLLRNSKERENAVGYVLFEPFRVPEVIQL